MAEEIERIYNIPLRKNGFKSSNAAPVAVRRVKKFLTRHMKVEEKNIWIDESLNNALWSRGKYKIPSKIRVKAVKFEDGVVEVYLPELEFKKSIREILKEEREKKEPILKKEEELEEGGGLAEGEIPGAEEYEIAPAAEGEVKIKKKKTAKEKKETEGKKKTTKSKEEKEKEMGSKKTSSKKKKAAAEKVEKKTSKTRKGAKGSGSKSSSKSSKKKKVSSNGKNVE